MAQQPAMAGMQSPREPWVGIHAEWAWRHVTASHALVPLLYSLAPHRVNTRGGIGCPIIDGRTTRTTGGTTSSRPAAYQQKKAERFDPYADNDIGPEVVGARPRDYQKPIPETSRARWTIPSTEQRQ